MVAHMGDTRGDRGGIIGIEKAGEIGIAFNYTDVLKEILSNIGREQISDKIYFVDPKSESSNLAKVLPIFL